MPRMLFVLVVLVGAVPVQAQPTGSAPLTFERQIRPLLKAHCWHCHGEGEQLEGGLDARLAHLLIRGGDSGAALVPGKASESLLVARIQAGEMPPGKKKLSPAEISLLTNWINQGAQTARPEPVTPPSGDSLSEEDREHWSFQPIACPSVPPVKHAELADNPIDRFLLARLEQDGLSFGPLAAPAALVRRLSFDLVGLPPSPEMVQRFVADPSDVAYQQLVDQLLASPAYGQRWARHWLDVVGYADSDGYNEADRERPWAYRYRDYVIRSLNDDKPWNEFLIEQLAGDELLTPPYANLSPQQADKLIATGMLRMAPDGTADSAADQLVARNDVVADTVKVLSTAVLGLTVGCAQCHDHRYDPISQLDYHRLRAVIEPALDPAHWRTPDGRLISLWSDETRQRAEQVDAELKDISQRRMAELDELVSTTFEQELAKLPADLQPKARVARSTAADKRDAEQQQLIKDYPFLNVDRGSVYLYLPDRQNGFNKKWDDLTAATRAKRPADDLVHCLTEVPGQAPATRLLARGDVNQPRGEVPPGELSVLNAQAWNLPSDDPAVPTSGRRLAYARHLTDGRHPLVARVLVNRFWMHHFGRGLVATPGDFGLLGQRPSHPELLDWLAQNFMQNRWQLKRLHRQIVTSHAYRQSSVRRDELEAIDPENRLLGRMSVRRLEAETIRDAILSASGRLSARMDGPSVPVTPDEVGQIVVGVDTRLSDGRPSGKVVPLGDDEFRRSIYVQVRRSKPLGMLEPFDLPVMSPNCESRATSTVAPQSLLMMNSALVVDQAQAMAQRVERDAGPDPAAQFQRAWLLAYSQPPSDAEFQAGLEYLREQSALAPAPAADAKGPQPTPGQHALAALCHALLISNGFLYVD